MGQRLQTLRCSAEVRYYLGKLQHHGYLFNVLTI